MAQSGTNDAVQTNASPAVQINATTNLDLSVQPAASGQWSELKAATAN